MVEAYQFSFPSPRIPPAPEFAGYAQPSFTAGRPFLEAAVDLCHRIYVNFHYDKQATTVATSVAEMMRSRSEAFCQDFAHVAIACLRSNGHGGAICERLFENRRFDRQPGVARLGMGLLPGSRLV